MGRGRELAAFSLMMTGCAGLLALRFPVALAIGITAVASIALVAYVKGRLGLSFVLLTVVLVGALRKWVFPGYEQALYFLPDLLLLAVYAGVVSRQVLEVKQPAISQIPGVPLLFLLGLWIAVETLNWRLGSPLVGILGLKAYLFYVPLLWVVPRVLDNQDDLTLAPARYGWLAIPLAAIALLQFSSPPDAFINRYVWEEGPGVATFDYAGVSFVRVTATFSYITGYATFLIAMFPFLLVGLLFVERRSARALTLSALVLSLVGAVLTGSRSPVLVMLASLALLLVFSFVGGWRRRPAWHLSIVLASSLGVLLLVVYLQGATSAFVSRVQSAGDTRARVEAIPNGIVEAAGIASLFGYGAGRTHQGAFRAAELAGVPQVGEPIPMGYEEETERVVLELGVVGFLLWYGYRVLFLIWVLRAALTASSRLQSVLAAVAVFHFLVLVFPIVFNAVLGFYYWLSAGIAVAAKVADNEAAEPARPEHGGCQTDLVPA
jgi:hypothetical protein